MSQPNLESASMPSVIKKKPQMNIYTVLLLIALVSLLMACLFLYLEINEYGGLFEVKGRMSSVATPIVDSARSLLA